MIKLKKTHSPSSYSGAGASYDILRDGVKVGEFRGVGNRKCGRNAHHYAVDIHGNRGPAFVSTRGWMRLELNKWAETIEV